MFDFAWSMISRGPVDTEQNFVLFQNDLDCMNNRFRAKIMFLISAISYFQRVHILFSNRMGTTRIGSIYLRAGSMGGANGVGH